MIYKINLMALVYYPALAWATWKGWVPVAICAILLLRDVKLTIEWRR